MRLRPALLVSLAAAAVSAAVEPAVRLPAEVRARPGRLVRLAAETDGKMVRWASAPAPGRYRVLAWTVVGDVPSEAAVCVVVVEGPGPEDRRRPELPGRVGRRGHRGRLAVAGHPLDLPLRRAPGGARVPDPNPCTGALP